MSRGTIWANLKARKRLISAFKNAGLFLGDAERPIYPSIKHVNAGENATAYTFTLPNGMDPALLKKNLYALQQTLGKNIEIDGEIKRFTLTVSHRTLPKKLPYNEAAIQTLVEGCSVPIVCGKDVAGNYVVYDAETEPACLISGEPGAGKSTQVRSILTTLIRSKTPAELNLYLGDLKLSEFFIFKGVEHVKSVCIYPDDLARMLEHLHGELKRRGELLNKHEVTHVNKLPAAVRPPAILLAIDEMVMIMDDKEMRRRLVQIASLGRALAIYCIFSLQRASFDILDTKIRSLLTVRMGFRTTDLANSRIIGTPGSERISKKTPGRFLIKRDELTELQAPYLSEEKAVELLAPYRAAGWTDMFACGTMNDVVQSEAREITEKDVFADVD